MPTPTSSIPCRPFVGPARVIAAAGSSKILGDELGALGISPEDGTVLVVPDAAVLRLGLADAALSSARSAGYDVCVGPGVAGEPTPDTVRGLADCAQGRRLSAVVAVGGGSAIDAAKLAGLAQTNDLALEDGLAATAAVRSGPPVSAIVTTAGTGAEATSVAMLWHTGRKRIFVHDRLVPRHAMLDPELLRQLPSSVVAASGLDAISHAVESMLSTFRTPLTLARSHAALARLAGSLRAACAGGDDDDRLAMLVGAYEAGLSLNASVVVGHSLAYAIAARTGLSHGVTCAMALPYCLAYCRPAREDDIAAMGEHVGVGRDGDAVLDWLVALTADVGIPASLSEVGIARADLAPMTDEVLERYPRPNSPVPLSRDALLALLGHFHDGDTRAAWAAAGKAEIPV
jgi:alcohol dehydrogenase class IV